MTLELPSYTPRSNAKWEEVRYRRSAFADERLNRYSEAIDSIYVNGYSDFAVFEATNRDDFFSADRYDHRGMRVAVESLLDDPAVRIAFSSGPTPNGHARDLNLDIVNQGGCQFEGLLADVLLHGGAYGKWKGSVEDAKAVATDAVLGMRAAAPDRPWAPYLVPGVWCSYFQDVAWDYTFVIQFPYDARWLIFCATDTD